MAGKDVADVADVTALQRWRPGGTLPNGAVIVDVKVLDREREGVVLAISRGAALPCVTWIIDLPTGDTYSGHYFRTAGEAAIDFEVRR